MAEKVRVGGETDRRSVRKGFVLPNVERTTILFVLFFFITGLFLFSLFQHQVLDHDQYVAAAQAQSTSTTQQPAQRGQILAQDKDGKTFSLAVSDWQYDLEISPRQVKDKQKLLDNLKQDIPTLNVADVLSKINNSKVYVPPVVSGLDAETANKVTESNYAGVFIIPKLIRVYPDGSNIAPQVLGFVGSDGQGKYGIESSQDPVLQGTSGGQTSKLDSLGRLISILGGSQSQAGKDVVLTIDYNLQYTVEQKLKQSIDKYKADSGSVIVIDPNTGAVLADAGDPSYDPNNISSLTGADLYKLLDSNISNTYEPGSVVKPITMAMALDSGVVTPETTHNAGGSVTIDGHEIKNALNKNFGNENMSQIIQNSDNVQMVWISGLIGLDKHFDYLQKFGFGQKTGANIDGEQSGYLPAKKSWNKTLEATSAFGQGISTTLIQLAVDYSVIANGGHLITPNYVAKYINDGVEELVKSPPAGAQIISADTASKVKAMLVDTVNLGEGHAAKVQGISVGGKTGTAQVPDDKGGYDATKTVGSFIGMFPADNPKFVLAVRINNPKTVNFAESSAAPTFGDIASWMTNYYGLR